MHFIWFRLVGDLLAFSAKRNGCCSQCFRCAGQNNEPAGGIVQVMAGAQERTAACIGAVSTNAAAARISTALASTIFVAQDPSTSQIEEERFARKARTLAALQFDGVVKRLDYHLG